MQRFAKHHTKHVHVRHLGHSKMQFCSNLFENGGTAQGTLTTETKMSSFWRNFNHWLHWKLSFWQLPVQPVMKISSKWRHFRFSEPFIIPTCPSDAPASTQCFLVRSRFSALRPVMATEAPWRAKSTAVAAPIPELAPGDKSLTHCCLMTLRGDTEQVLITSNIQQHSSARNFTEDTSANNHQN